MWLPVMSLQLTYKSWSPVIIDRSEFKRLDVDGENYVILDVLENDVVADNADVVDDAVDETLHIAGGNF